MRHCPDREFRSPFAVLDDAFALLCTGPHPLAVHGADIGGRLPARPIPLTELKCRLLHPATPYSTRDAAITVLLRYAQTQGGAWTVGLAGVLLPALRTAAKPLTRLCPHRAEDIEAEMLTGLLTAIATTRVGRSRPAAHLTWVARRRAEALVRAESAERARPAHHPISAAPPQPFGHPDLVLVDAVREQVISAADAELIGATRLGEMSLAQAADARGMSYTAANLRRWRAENALVAWIGDGGHDHEF